MQLAQTIIRQLETDKTFLTLMLEHHGRVEANVVLDEEPGEVLITLLMKKSEICEAIKQAVKEFFGDGYLVSNASMRCGKRLITFTISKSCSNS